MAPKLGGGWLHNYSTKTRQGGHANELSMYSLMSMFDTACGVLHTFKFLAELKQISSLVTIDVYVLVNFEISVAHAFENKYLQKAF